MKSIFEELIDNLNLDCYEIMKKPINNINTMVLASIDSFVKILKNKRKSNVEYDFSVFDNYKSKFFIRRDDKLIISGVIEIDVLNKIFEAYLIDLDGWNKKIIKYKIGDSCAGIYKTKSQNWYTEKIKYYINEFNLKILWSKMTFVYTENSLYNNRGKSESKVVCLPENYTDSELDNWWNNININSDSYEISHCFGIVMFHDKSWIEFYIYDDLDTLACYRKFPDYNNFSLDKEYDSIFEIDYITDNNRWAEYYNKKEV